MWDALINLGIFALIGLTLALPVILYARYTRDDEPGGNRFLGMFVDGFRDKDREDERRR